MKRLFLAIIAVAFASGPVQAHSAITYRVPQIRSSYSYLRLPTSRDRDVQMIQTAGILGLEIYKTRVAERHGDRAIDIARRDRELQYREVVAQQNARLEVEQREMSGRAEIEKLRQENERLRLELERQRLLKQLEKEQER